MLSLVDKNLKIECFNRVKQNFIDLCKHSYGNLIVLLSFDIYETEKINMLITYVIDNVNHLSIQKNSYKVVEKVINMLNDERKQKLTFEIFNLLKINIMIKNIYGKYILTKCFENQIEDEKILVRSYVNNNLWMLNEKDQELLIDFLESI